MALGAPETRKVRLTGAGMAGRLQAVRVGVEHRWDPFTDPCSWTRDRRTAHFFHCQNSHSTAGGAPEGQGGARGKCRSRKSFATQESRRARDIVEGVSRKRPSGPDTSTREQKNDGGRRRAGLDSTDQGLFREWDDVLEKNRAAFSKSGALRRRMFDLAQLGTEARYRCHLTRPSSP